MYRMVNFFVIFICIDKEKSIKTTAKLNIFYKRATLCYGSGNLPDHEMYEKTE